jgi:hypothetical protein
MRACRVDYINARRRFGVLCRWQSLELADRVNAGSPAPRDAGPGCWR